MTFREIIAVYSDIHIKHVMNSVGETQRVLIVLWAVHIITTVLMWKVSTYIYEVIQFKAVSLQVQ
jgi:hypothetical protein